RCNRPEPPQARQADPHPADDPRRLSEERPSRARPTPAQTTSSRRLPPGSSTQSTLLGHSADAYSGLAALALPCSSSAPRLRCRPISIVTVAVMPARNGGSL